MEAFEKEKKTKKKKTWLQHLSPCLPLFEMAYVVNRGSSSPASQDVLTGWFPTSQGGMCGVIFKDNETGSRENKTGRKSVQFETYFVTQNVHTWGFDCRNCTDFFFFYIYIPFLPFKMIKQIWCKAWRGFFPVKCRKHCQVCLHLGVPREIMASNQNRPQQRFSDCSPQQ